MSDQNNQEQHKMGLLGLIATLVTSVIGGGMFIITINSQKDVYVGSSIIFSYIIGAIIAFLVALSYANLSSAMPRSGGDYIYVSRMFDPFVGFISSWVRWMGGIAGTAFLTLGAVEMLTALISRLSKINVVSESMYVFFNNNSLLLSLFIVIFLSIVNIYGVRSYAFLQKIIAFLMLAGISLFIIYGFSNFNPEFFINGLTFDIKNIILSASIIFWAFTGFQVVADIGGDVKDGERNIPKALLLGLMLVTIIYLIVAVTTYGLIPSEEFLNYNSIPDILDQTGPSFIYYFTLLAAFFAIIGGVGPGIASTSRVLYAWSLDEVVPKLFSKKSERNAPYLSIIAVILLIMSIIIFTDKLTSIVILSSMAVLISYSLTSFSSVLMRFRHKDIYDKSRFRFKGLWLFTLLGGILSLSLVVYILRSSSNALWFLSVWISLGSILYFFRYEKHKLFEKIKWELSEGLVGKTLNYTKYEFEKISLSIEKNLERIIKILTKH